MVNWENSYKYGEKKEKELLPILQEYFGKDIERSKGGRRTNEGGGRRTNEGGGGGRSGGKGGKEWNRDLTEVGAAQRLSP